jgi:hypothetical protein
VAQWAATHWQLEICRLLLAKGADVEARDWGGVFKPVTPLGGACLVLLGDHQRYLMPKHATDTLDLLLENGLDIHATVEIDSDLFSLGDSLCGSKTLHPIRRAVAQQFLWLLRKYIQATTCDGLLLCTELHPQACLAILQSKIYFDDRDGIWDEQRPDGELLTFMDTQAFQTFWLYMLAQATEYGDIFSRLSPQFCRSFTGDFHYQQPWVVDGHTSEQSPMQLALSSFEALRTFHYILKVSGTDIVQFTELESTMPWCTYTQEALMNFFSLSLQQYTYLEILFSARKICRRCHRGYQHEGLMNWEEILGLVRSGRSLASLLQVPSQEEVDALLLSSFYCEDCRLDTYTSSESDESEDDQTEDDAEHMGFIASEIEGDENPLSGMRVSGMGNERLEGGTDACSSDESSSDEDLE